MTEMVPKKLEINSQTSMCKNLRLVRDFARKKWPLRGNLFLRHSCPVLQQGKLQQESSYFNGFWTPAFAGVTGLELL